MTLNSLNNAKELSQSNLVTAEVRCTGELSRRGKQRRALDRYFYCKAVKFKGFLNTSAKLGGCEFLQLGGQPGHLTRARVLVDNALGHRAHQL